MKSKAPSHNQKSPSREALLKAAAEQYRIMVHNRLVASQDLVPPDCFTVKHLAKALGQHESAVKKMLRRLKVKPLKFRIFTGKSLHRVDHYKFT